MADVNIFANDLQIACKASSGKSTAAFPDPCWSPPSPSAGWIMVPYANTAKAKDLHNGSKTTFIHGKPVALKDKSYFKTSTGNEAADGPRGLTTTTETGKAFFRSWSMNFKIEGYNVCRHTDMMTHNHNPVPGNTGAWTYLSKGTKEACKDEMKKVDKACYDEKELGKKAQIRALKSQQRRKGKGKLQGNPTPKTWKDQHCLGALFPKEWLNKSPEELKELTDTLDKRIEDFKESMFDDAWDMAKDNVKDMGLGDILSPDWTWLCTGYGKLPCKAFDVYLEIKSKITDVVENLQKITAYSEKIASGEIDDLRETVVKDMEDFVAEEKCLQARKCMLVPYKAQHQIEKEGQANAPLKSYKAGYNEQRTGKSLRGFLGLMDSSGCCPGQTGHHLIPRSWAESACPGYNHNKAPVVCAEGPTQHDGTHSMLHKNLDGIIAEKYELQKTSELEEIPRDKAIDHAAEAHQQMYPEANDCMTCWGDSPCSKDCLKEQLEEFYGNGKCNDKFKAKLITGNQEDTGAKPAPTR